MITLLFLFVLIAVFLLVILISEKLKIIDFFTLTEKLNIIKDKTKNLPDTIIDYPIFYINMDKHTDRRENMERQLKKVCKEYYRIAGVNGYKIKNTSTDIIDGLHFVNKYPLTKPEIGCTLSHIKAIETAYKLNKEYVIICEDDITFDTIKLTTPISELVKKAPKDWEILQLIIGNGVMDDFKKKYDVNKIHYLEYDVYPGTCCYLINRKGMERMSKRGYLIEPLRPNFPYLGAADTYIFYICKTYTIFPPLFIPNNDQLESTIHPEHTSGHMSFADKVLDLYLDKL